MTPAEVTLAEPASPELFKRLCSGSPSPCVAKIDNLTVLAPIVGCKIDRGNWVFTDTVRYSWCTSSTCYYVGTVNVYADIYLEWREAYWVQTIDASAGPAVRGTLRWNCVDDNGSLPITSCSGGWQTRTNTVYTTGPFQRTGHNHNSDTGTFWYDFRYSWNASGYPGITWNYGTFTSFHFRCNNTSGCYFP
jgi:hypothetical protein